MSEEHKEPPFALARELREEASDRSVGDKRLGQRIRRVHRRVKAIEDAAPAMASSLQKVAFNAKINNWISIGIALILILMLTKQWPELWPGLFKAILKAVGA